MHANVNARSYDGWTPLLGAADGGYLEVVKILLSHGADTSKRIGNMDAAVLAESKGHKEVADFIRPYIKKPGVWEGMKAWLHRWFNDLVALIAQVCHPA